MLNATTQAIPHITRMPKITSLLLSFMEICVLAFWFVANRQTYRVYKATRDLRMLCDSFASALKVNGDKVSQTSRDLDQMLLDQSARDIALSTAINNVTLDLMAHAKARNTLPQPQEVLNRLSKTHRDVLAELNILRTKIQEKQQKLDRLNHLENRLTQAHEKCMSHYETIDLATHVNDIVSLVSSLKYEGVSTILDRLVLDVGTLIDTTQEVSEAVDSEAIDFQNSFRPLTTKTPGLVDIVSCYMNTRRDIKDLVV